MSHIFSETNSDSETDDDEMVKLNTKWRVKIRFLEANLKPLTSEVEEGEVTEEA